MRIDDIPEYTFCIRQDNVLCYKMEDSMLVFTSADVKLMPCNIVDSAQYFLFLNSEQIVRAFKNEI